MSWTSIPFDAANARFVTPKSVTTTSWPASRNTATGQTIVAPIFLKEYRPDVVIVMNAVYRTEIVHDLNQLGLTPVVTTLHINKENGD